MSKFIHVLCFSLNLAPPLTAQGGLPKYVLRSEPNEALSEQAVMRAIERYDFFVRQYNWNADFSNGTGRGITHDFTLLENGDVVFDAATGLHWQKSGSSRAVRFREAAEYIRQINESRYGGFDDWRLPTVEEALSLISPEQYRRLYTLRIFYSASGLNRHIWTADKTPESVPWYVNYAFGYAAWGNIPHHVTSDNSYIKAVRSQR